MIEQGGDAARRQSGAFLSLYALAYAGGVVAYTPFLMLVLPARVTELAGTGDIRWLGYIVFAGAVAASVSGVFSGWLSDRTRMRRTWIAAGLVLTVGLQLAMVRSGSIDALLWMIAAWQIALNLMLVPLIAWAGDLVPDDQKGLLGGLFSIAPALGAWSGILLRAEVAVSFGGQLLVIAAATTVLILPVLLFGRPLKPAAPPAIRPDARPWSGPGPAAARMWVARLLIQISGAALASYLYFWLRAIDPGIGRGEMTALFAGSLSVSVVTSLALGRWSDRHGHGFRVLSVLAAVAGVALIGMAHVGGVVAAKAAYVLFATAGATFLALHASQTFRVLGDPARRGLGIGLFNLTNTAPSLVMPWIAISVVPAFGFQRLFLILALLALAASFLLATTSHHVRRAAPGTV
jgi:MFS family permease